MNRKECVLVVDDDANNRSLVCAVLEGRYEVLEAANAEEAYHILGTRTVDVVLLDVMMPGEDGHAACRKIKDRHKDEFLPVLLLTALSDQDSRNQGLAAGADDFLSKPIDRRELTLRIGAFLRLRRLERTTAHQRDSLVRLAALKDDLVGLLVHDLRNPLTAVLGFLQLVESTATDAEMLADLQAARRAAERVGEAIQDLLQITMLEEGRLVPERSGTALAGLVDEALAIATGSARTRDVSLVRRGADVQGHVDPRLFRRAVENLVSNAIYHAPPTSEVEVNLHATSDGFEVEVLDRGPGIPDAKKPHVFEKFGGVDAEKTRQRRGFGLGLYFVDLVVRAHGGTVAVQDRAGGGAAFRIAIPAAL